MSGDDYTREKYVDEINELADVIGEAIAKHTGGNINVQVVLSALSTIAADVISKLPKRGRDTMLSAWDESPAWVRNSIGNLRT